MIMSSYNTVDERWTICPASKYNKTDKSESKYFIVNSVSITGLSWMDMRCSNHTLDITEYRVKQLEKRGCPMEWFIRLINYMMKIGADITKDQRVS